MTERQASRALTKLIDRGAIHVIRRGFKGKVALYSLYPARCLAEINPGLKCWIDGTAEPPDDE